MYVIYMVCININVTNYYYIGLAERRCNSDGTWGEVDVTACTSQEFNNIIIQVRICTCTTVPV